MDLHTRWSHRWLNSKAEARASAIAGTGTFAKEIIKEGEPVIVLGGVIVPIEELSAYKREMGQVGVQISDEFFTAPTSRDELEKFGAINHSCEPNLGFDGSIVLRAIRDIPVGAECVIDYGFGYSEHLDSFMCGCGNANCRKQITKDDWKLQSLQQRYGSYFAPFIRKKIEKII